jgi:hypothetical protein
MIHGDPTCWNEKKMKKKDEKEMEANWWKKRKNKH